MKKLSILILSLAFVGVTGCSDKETVTTPIESGEPTMTTFKIATPAGYALGDPEDGTDDENQINTVEFYLFDSTGSRDEKTDTHDYCYHRITNLTSDEVSLLVKAGTAKKVLVAVNCDLGENADLHYDGMETLLELLELDNTNSQQMDAGKFVMSGKEVADIHAHKTDNKVTVAISRVVSKVMTPKVNPDFEVKIPQEDLNELFGKTVNSDQIKFELENYALINGYNRAYTFTCYNAADDEEVFWDKWLPGGKYFPTTFKQDATKDLETAYSGLENGSPWLSSATVFVYENQPTDTVDVATGIKGYKKESVYALLIKGKLVNKEDNSFKTRYWRINLIQDDNYKMFRNTIYRITLDEVRTVGYGTAEEAEEDEDNGGIVPDNENASLQVSVEIVPWRVKLQNTQF